MVDWHRSKKLSDFYILVIKNQSARTNPIEENMILQTNNSDIFSTPVNAYQLLFVFNHINSLSDFLYSHNYLDENEQFKSIPIVNSLYAYLRKNADDLATRTKLLHELFDNGNLYGRGKNGPANPDDLNEMFDDFIGNVVFKKYGNIHGFLAMTMLTTNNLTLSSFKKEMKFNLQVAYFTNEDGSNSYLSDFAVEKILDQLIHPLFPQVNDNMSIISPDYIYAQAGLSFARAARMDLKNLTFEELVEISQILESSVREGLMDDTILRIFALPAMLYYFHTEKNLLRNERMEDIVRSSHNWTIAYKYLFEYLDSIFGRLQNTLREAQEGNPEYHFEIAMSQYKTRTQLADENIRMHCPLDDEKDHVEAVNDYKNSPEMYFCREGGLTLPNINNIFYKQNQFIADRYSSLEKHLIENAFGGIGMQLIDDTIYKCQGKYTSFMSELSDSPPVPFYSQTVKENVDLFEIYSKSTKASTYHALIRENGKIEHIFYAGQSDFYERIGLSDNLGFERTHVLKSEGETFDIFATRIAEGRANFLKKILHEKGYEETNREMVIKILLSFIPFYSCVDNIIKGETAQAVMLCSLDALSLIPVYGAVMNIGFKIFSKTLLMTLGTSIRTFASKQSIYLSLRTLGKGVSSLAVAEFPHIFTMETFKSISVSLLRSLDPGFEFIGKLAYSGIRSTTRLFKLIKQRVSPQLYNKISKSLEKLETSLKSTTMYRTQGTNRFENGYVFTSAAAAEQFEWRRIFGSQNEVLVKLEKVDNGKNIYRKVSLNSRKTFGPELELKNNLLQLKVPSLTERIKKIKDVGLSGRGSIAASRQYSKLDKEERDRKALEILDKYNNDRVPLARKILGDYLLEEKGKTELDLVRSLMQNPKLPDWISELKLEEPNLFKYLRYQESLSTPGISFEAAVSRIEELYGQKQMQFIDVFMKEVVDIFNEYSYQELEFEDLYAIYNYEASGFMRIREETDEARRMQNAFYRVAVRQADDPGKPEKLYRGEARDSFVANSFTEGSIITINRFTSASLEESTAHVHLFANSEQVSVVPILYEIQLDSTFLTADMYKILPSGELESVLIPGVKLLIHKVEDVTIFFREQSKKVKKVYAKNVPVNKSQWLISLMKRIKELKDSGTKFYLDPSKRY